MKRNMMVWILLIFTLGYAFPSEEVEVMKGFVYREGSEEKDLMYIQKEIREGTYDSLKISHRYFSSDEELEAYESVVLENGSLGLYETAINGLGFKGSLELVDGRVRLVRVKDGKYREKKIRNRENLVVGPLLPSFVEENISTLQKGETVVFHLPFFDGMTLIPMLLEAKEGDRDYTGRHVVVEMRMKSRLLSWFIQPVDMTFDLDMEKITEIHGPTILPDPRGGGGKDYVEANIYYQYGGI